MVYNMYLVVVILVNLFLIDGILTETIIENHCADQMKQERILISQLTGMWFAVETISHLQLRTPEEKRYYEETEIDTDTCPVVSISDKPDIPLPPMYRNLRNYNQSYGPGFKVYETHQTHTDQPNDRYYHSDQDRSHRYKQSYYKKYEDRKYLSVTWDEGYTTFVYAAYYTDPVGLWRIYEPSEDELSPPVTSSHPVGNIQVLKAVGNHMVLTFCIIYPEHKFYTVILSRYRGLDQAEISGVHNLLRRLNFEFVTRRRMCNGATQLTLHYAFTMLALIYTLIIVS